MAPAVAAAATPALKEQEQQEQQEQQEPEWFFSYRNLSVSEMDLGSSGLTMVRIGKEFPFKAWRSIEITASWRAGSAESEPHAGIKAGTRLDAGDCICVRDGSLHIERAKPIVDPIEHDTVVNAGDRIWIRDGGLNEISALSQALGRKQVQQHRHTAGEGSPVGTPVSARPGTGLQFTCPRARGTSNPSGTAEANGPCAWDVNLKPSATTRR